MGMVNRLSKILGPPVIDFTKENFVSKSQKLFFETGLIHNDNGKITLLPILMKSLQKLKMIVHEEMKEISAFEFSLPILTSSALYKKSGRFDLPQIFKVNSKSEVNSYVLSPTCEEAATYFVKSFYNIKHNHLPVRLYQISTKFRDELRPRSGIIRTKEFLMKDLYCFDSNIESCEQCYQEVLKQYHHFFDCLEVPYVCAEASVGEIGGLKSHEFHFLTDAGQDKVISCQSCGYIENLENQKQENGTKCSKCQSSNFTIEHGLEVGHTFIIGTKFSEAFQLTYTSDKTKKFLYMSSYGLGLTRILGACVDVLSTSDAIRWPMVLAPYLVCIIPPKVGSKEELAAQDLSQKIYSSLSEYLKDDLVLDDRVSLTVGNRLNRNKKLGLRFFIIIGKSILDDPPTVELLDAYSDSTMFVQVPDIRQEILNKLQMQNLVSYNTLNCS